MSGESGPFYLHDLELDLSSISPGFGLETGFEGAGAASLEGSSAQDAAGAAQNIDPSKCGVGLTLSVEWKGSVKGKGGPHGFGAAGGTPLGKPQEQDFPYGNDSVKGVATWTVTARVQDRSICYLTATVSLKNIKWSYNAGAFGSGNGSNPDTTLSFEFGDKRCRRLICEETITRDGLKLTHQVKFAGLVSVTIEVTCDASIDVKTYTTDGKCPEHGLPYPHEGSFFHECFEEYIKKLREELEKHKPPLPHHPK